MRRITDFWNQGWSDFRIGETCRSRPGAPPFSQTCRWIVSLVKMHEVHSRRLLDRSGSLFYPSNPYEDFADENLPEESGSPVSPDP